MRYIQPSTVPRSLYFISTTMRRKGVAGVNPRVAQFMASEWLCVRVSTCTSACAASGGQHVHTRPKHRHLMTTAICAPKRPYRHVPLSACASGLQPLRSQQL